MNITRINTVSNNTFFAGKSENPFTNSQLERIEQNKDLIDALCAAGVIKKANIKIINKALDKRHEEIRQAQLAEAERLEKIQLEEDMQYVLKNIASPRIDESSKENRREESRMEYDEFTDIYYTVTYQDIKLQKALNFIAEHGGVVEYNRLLTYKQEHSAELAAKGKEIDALMDNMEEETRTRYSKNNDFDTSTCLHETYNVESVIKNNPITSLNNTIAVLKDKLKLA